MAEFGTELGLRYEKHYGRPRGEGVTLAEIWPLYFSDPHTAPAMPPIEDRDDLRSETMKSVSDHYARETLLRGLPQLAIPIIFVHGVLGSSTPDE